jgi:hypothetical protein
MNPPPKIEEIKALDENENELKIGDKVKCNYSGKTITGTIIKIYNKIKTKFDISISEPYVEVEYNENKIKKFKEIISKNCNKN